MQFYQASGRWRSEEQRIWFTGEHLREGGQQRLQSCTAVAQLMTLGRTINDAEYINKMYGGHQAEAEKAVEKQDRQSGVCLPTPK